MVATLVWTSLVTLVSLGGYTAVDVIHNQNCTSTDNGIVLQVHCEVRSGLNFSDVRRWVLQQVRSAIHLDIVCVGGNLTLSHPMEAGNLTELRINNCVKIKGLFAEFQELDTPPQPASGTLEVLEIINSSYLYNKTGVLEQAERLQKIYGCMTFFPRGLRVLKLRYTKFDKMSNSNGFDGFQDMPFGNICYYDNLEMYERSGFQSPFGILDRKIENEIFYFLRFGSFQKLHTANFSDANLEFIPARFTEYNWFRQFRSLRIIDLSHNRIKEIPYLRRPNHFGKLIKLILRHNNISRITKTLIEKLKMSNMAVDFAKNKFVCACESDLEPVLQFVRNQIEESWAVNYHYLANETCYYPSSLQGMPLRSLDSLVLCPNSPARFRSWTFQELYIGLIVLTFITIVCLVVKFRKEIKILTYTRLGIRFWRPHRSGVIRLKEYDAFVSYSALDESWVMGTLCKRLEGLCPPLRLCLHHKHFVLGACISDNIIESVEKSRHTIIVLSQNFLQSEWCLLEFRKAFHQTLLERRRHLIVILMDQINLDTLEPEMNYFLQSHTYLKRTDTLFWDRLIYAVSDICSAPIKSAAKEVSTTLNNLEDVPLDPETHYSIETK